MKKGGKIALWSVGGLAVATGLFFGIRALVNRGKNGSTPDIFGCTDKKADNYNRLANIDNGSCKYGSPTPPNGGGGGNGGGGTPNPTIIGGSFPIRFGDRGDHVEALQRAMANKWGDDWCSASMCNGGTWRSPISVDGVFGEQSALYTNCHYPSTNCALCPLFGKGSLYPIGSADYSQCSVSYSKFASIVGSEASKYKNYAGTEDYYGADGDYSYYSADGQRIDDLQRYRQSLGGYSNAEGRPEPKSDIQLGKEGGCPCWEGDTNYNPCCMPDFENIATPNMNPYSNMGGFSGEVTNDGYLNMGIGTESRGLKGKFNWLT